jgi:hypothetical protein
MECDIDDVCAQVPRGGGRSAYNTWDKYDFQFGKRNLLCQRSCNLSRAVLLEKVSSIRCAFME